jgi:hypothetical protein
VGRAQLADEEGRIVEPRAGPGRLRPLGGTARSGTAESPSSTAWAKDGKIIYDTVHDAKDRLMEGQWWLV